VVNVADVQNMNGSLCMRPIPISGSRRGTVKRKRSIGSPHCAHEHHTATHIVNESAKAYWESTSGRLGRRSPLTGEA